jgi:hypothetical protein
MTEVTYGRVDKVLRALGFSCRTTTIETEANIYEHRETGAVIILPAVSKRKSVLPHHLAAVQGTLAEYGIADAIELSGELHKAS